MRIANVDTFPLGYREPNDDDAWRYVVLVRLETDDGAVGWGECITQFKEATYATAALIEHGLAEVVLGENPLDVERLWEALRGRVWWYGDVGGIAAFAVSAIDMALWDLKGKLLNVPLYTLFGGKQQERLPVCASTHPKASEIEAMADELAGHVAAGYQLVKVGFGKKGHANLGVTAARDIAFVRAVRRAIGPDAGFIVDIGAKMRWNLPHAVRMAQEFLPYQLTWLEDVFHPDNMRDYAHLRRAVPGMMIGFGERFWTVQSYHELMQADVCDVILVDPGRTEGVTGMLKIMQLAKRYNIQVDAHSWSSAINTAASLHLCAAFSNVPIFELKPLRNPMQHELVTEPLGPADGWITAPDGPGLGVEVIEATVRRYDLRRT